MKKEKKPCLICYGTGNSAFVGCKKCPACKGKGYKVIKKTPENYIEL
jgi:DnaJ-class molecular chaperone